MIVFQHEFRKMKQVDGGRGRSDGKRLIICTSERFWSLFFLEALTFNCSTLKCSEDSNNAIMNPFIYTSNTFKASTSSDTQLRKK